MDRGHYPVKEVAVGMGDWMNEWQGSGCVVVLGRRGAGNVDWSIIWALKVWKFIQDLRVAAAIIRCELFQIELNRIETATMHWAAQLTDASMGILDFLRKWGLVAASNERWHGQSSINTKGTPSHSSINFNSPYPGLDHRCLPLYIACCLHRLNFRWPMHCLCERNQNISPVT